ncbi:hypothetical protein AAG570_013581 [Ranatra chinensis]|uniref:Uncharacterized protein n=1 Tax=Ranatra chinensis TaxID=642074 RepID=A0ABD0YEH7_9HEMI
MEESPKPQFDETLGGSEKLPLNLNVKYFTKARMKEIEALTEAIEDPLQQGMLFQRLPRHMRRRAMGHDDKRMPKKLRKTFSVLLEKCGTKDQPKSRPRRKYRRRPCHLLDEYNRRQREFIWLETHIWHAKRFHMVNKWGYKLANYPNDKCFRACYRATAQHCLLQDISYYNCIEIRGELEKLLNGFTQHTSTACGLTFSAKCFLNGTKEGQVTFFRRNQYPKGAIGDVSFIWKPEIESDNTRIIWVWVHPALFEEFITEMTCTFELSQVVPDDSCEMEVCDVPENTDSDFTNSVEGKKLKLKNIPFVKVPKYENKLSGISLHVLKDTLNRFRLTGPLTQSVITEAFQAVNLDYFEKSSEEMNQSFKEYFIGHNKRKESATLQHAFWEQIKQVATPAQLPPSCVFSINVVDPRLTMPCKRTKADKDKQECKAQMLPNSYSNLIADSPLWCSKMRDSVTKEKVPSAELYAQRSMKIVPGLEIEQLDTQKNRQTIPILCIQQPGGDSNQRLGYGAGVDLIIPSGWSMPVWIGLVFRGARTGGLREAESLRREIGKLPLFAPDTRAAKTEGDDLETNLLEEYFRGLFPLLKAALLDKDTFIYLDF